MARFRLTLAYDGTDYGGSQVQPNQRTVQGELERALGAILGISTRTTWAGRTDRGVHATGQVAAFDAPGWTRGAVRLRGALNASLPRDVRVLGAQETSDSFHPRFDAAWREYRYWIAAGIENPFISRYAWTPRAEADLGAMNAGATFLVGTHDFASFAGGGEGVPWSARATRPRGTTRTLYRCEGHATSVIAGPGSDPELVIEVVATADGFLPRMVRNIVGALMEVGQGRQGPQWIDAVLNRRDRRLGSVLAPAHGLTLTAVGFHDDPPFHWESVMPGRHETDEGAA